jgi:hypothetical protein
MISNVTIKITYGQRNTKHAQPHGTVPFYVHDLWYHSTNTVPPGGNFPSRQRSRVVVDTYRGHSFHGLAE